MLCQFTVLVPRIPVGTKCRMHNADCIQNVDCRVGIKYRPIIWSVFSPGMW